MKIKRTNNQLIVETTKAKTVYAIAGKVKSADDYEILLTHDQGEQDAHRVRVINNPGEYETSDVFVYALSKEGHEVDVFAIEADHLSLMVTSNDRKAIKATELDKINATNILICVINTADYEQIGALIEEVEPSVLIVTGENADFVEGFVKKMSLSVTAEPQTSYTFGEEEFETEIESSMRVYLLK